MKIAIEPESHPSITDAVRRAGAEIAPASEADGIVWMSAVDVDGLRRALAASPARWVQLPFAGIERYVDAGVVTGERTWTCAKGTYGPATAEHALALMLAAARLLASHARRQSWAPHDPRHRRLDGTCAAIVGTGGIGTALAGMLSPLDVRLLAVNRSGSPAPWASATTTNILEVAPEADWLVVAAAATPDTRHLVDRRVLAAMRSDAWLINVARGSLVDTDALVAALAGGTIAGAALDVTDPEPLPDGHPLWSMDNALITSHTANTLEMALPELARLVERNVRAFAAGEPLDGLVDPTLGY